MRRYYIVYHVMKSFAIQLVLQIWMYVAGGDIGVKIMKEVGTFSY